MSNSEIENRLDILADNISADIDAHREPSSEDVEQYAESLCDYLRESPTEFFEWARKAFGRAA